jgi:hypothetical protein
MNFKEWLLLSEGQMANIKTMQPETVITVFHGTDPETAFNFCLNGIDAKTKTWRKHPHISGGKEIKFGIFIAPNLKTAKSFGQVVVKFKTQGKNLINKFPVEMKVSDRPDSFYSKQLPKSFRPSTSYELADLKSKEPQAIYIGLLSPRAIEKVFVYDYNTWTPMSREEYIDYYPKINSKTRAYKNLFEPQEYNISLEDFVKRLAYRWRKTPESVLDLLKDIYKKNKYLTGIGKMPQTLLKNIERKLSKIT